MAGWERDVRDALERGRANDLGVPRARYRREPEPLPENRGWGTLAFLQPATPWHLLGVGVVIFLIGRVLGRAPLGDPLELLGGTIAVLAVLSLLFLTRSQPKRWRGRLIDLDTSWRARLYRRIYKR